VGPGLDASSALLLAGCAVLAAVAVTAKGRVPFLAAVGIALLNVVSLVVHA
jgi:hypothetical protein